LPDFIQFYRGYVKDDDNLPSPNEQILTMETERFEVPEILFNPIDIGLDEAGVVEATCQSLKTLSDEIQIGQALARIQLIGGSTKFYNFKNRFEQDLRPLVPDIFPMKILQDDEPELTVWRSIKQYSLDMEQQLWAKEYISKSFYNENGSNECNEIFNKLW